MRTFINNLEKAAYAAALALVVMLAVMLLSGCAQRQEAGGALRVAADILPLADFCRQVGGDAVEVEMLVPPGASPHAYELTAGQVRFLADADVLVTVGLGLTPWADDVFEKAGNPDLAAVVAGEAVPRERLIPAVEELAVGGEDAPSQEHDGRDHGVFDPHLWLDPELAGYVVEAVRDAFAARDPEHAAQYADNARRYLEELAALDREIVQGMEGLAQRGFIAFHSAWTYFARRYGLEQVGVIEPRPGKEPSAGEIAALVELAASRGIKVIFTEPQFSPRTAAAIAEESGGRVAVRLLDPLGDPGDPSCDTYLELMRKNLAVMVEAMR